MIHLTICWKKKGRIPQNRKWILSRFNISTYMSVNCETECDIKDEDLKLLEECEKRGAIQIRYKKNEH